MVAAKKLSREDQVEELQRPTVVKEEIGSASSTCEYCWKYNYNLEIGKRSLLVIDMILII